MENKLAYTKMQERLAWAFEELKKNAKENGLTVSDDVLFTQAVEIAKTLFVRSEIQYSGRKG